MVTKNMTRESLLFVINDCLETIRLQESFNREIGKYYDQIGACRQELARREAKQAKKVKR